MNKLTKQQVLIVLAILAFIMMSVAGYFLYIQPKKQSYETAKQTLATENDIIDTLEAKLASKQTVSFENTVMLQKQIPVKQLLEQIVLDIEKAETLSQSFVLTMDLGDGEATETEEIEVDLEKDNQDTTNTTTTSDTTETEAAKQPADMKKIVIKLTVESPNYFDMKKFLSTIEKSERIFVIEEIEFEGQEEVIDVDQETKPINYNLTLSAYYMPNLTDLIEDLPKFEIPKPSDKKDPFQTFPDVDGGTSQESE